MWVVKKIQGRVWLLALSKKSGGGDLIRRRDASKGATTYSALANVRELKVVDDGQLGLRKSSIKQRGGVSASPHGT